MQGKRTIFSTRSCIGGQQWPTLSQPTCFQSGARRRPCCLHPSGAATHLPLSRPFCCRRTYLQRSLQEVTSQHESFMPDISGYIWERVNVGCQSKDDIRITWATCKILRVAAYISGANVGLGWISYMCMCMSAVGYLLAHYRTVFLVGCIANWVGSL